MQEMGQRPGAIFLMARLGRDATSTRRGLLALTLLMILEDSNRCAEQARITYLMMMSYSLRSPEGHKLAYFGGHKFEEMVNTSLVVGTAYHTNFTEIKRKVG